MVLKDTKVGNPWGAWKRLPTVGCKRATGNWQRSKRDANIHITPEQFAKPYRTCAGRLQLGLGPRGLTTAGKLTHFLSGDT